jgi:excisionase family DNA binding protein
MDTPALLTVAEVASHWRVSPHTVRVWIRQGRLPAVRLARRAIRLPAAVLATLPTSC